VQFEQTGYDIVRDDAGQPDLAIRDVASTVNVGRDEMGFESLQAVPIYRRYAEGSRQLAHVAPHIV